MESWPARVADVIARARAEGQLVEPMDAYSMEERGRISWCDSEVLGSQDLAVTVHRGHGNAVVRGFDASSARSRVSFTGSDNVVVLGPHSRFNNADIRIVGDGCTFYFGSFSTVESMIVMLTGPEGTIGLGDFCMLSARVILDRSDHHSIYDVDTGSRVNFDADVSIADHVWIGRDVRINKGVVIEPDVIVGQGSVVAGRLVRQTLYAGVPARPVRTGVTWSRMKSPSLDEMHASARHVEFLTRVNELRVRVRG